MTKRQALQLKKTLEEVHKKFVENNEIQNDALAPALKYENNRDREFAAFICAVLAYGKVSHIKTSVEKILSPMSDRPVDWLISADTKQLKKITNNWVHRFNKGQDMYLLLRLLKGVYEEHQSLEDFIQPTKFDDAYSLIDKLHKGFAGISVKKSLRLPTTKSFFWFLLSHPKSGSACKRLNLFLRWMVGRSEMDLSLWSRVSTRQLLIPVDTHVLKQSRALKLTKRTAADWKTAIEITESLKKLDPEDPTRFDFAICHLGINKQVVGAGRRPIILK